MVEDPVLAVPPFQGAVEGTVRIPVKLHPQVDDPADILGGFVHQDGQGLCVVLESACNEGILLVQLYIILRGVVDPGDAPLSQGGVAQGQLPFTDQKHPQGCRKVESSVQTGSAASGNDDVIVISHNNPILSS